MTRDALLELLLEHTDAYISGAELARRLSVSRTAVWKGIEQLRSRGYRIDSLTNRGYRLSSESDVLSAAGIERYLRTEGIRLQICPSVTSTNTVLKCLAAEGAPEGTAVVAGEQTMGRGRLGRSFFSPAGSGVYLSVLLRPGSSAAETVKLTACAAVAVAEAIESVSGADAQIKWVNDVYVRGGKVAGILTEASIDCESGTVDYVVIGIGINLGIPPGGFPPELRGVAGAVFDGGRLPAARCRVAAAVLDRLLAYYRRPESGNCYDEYRRRSLVLNRRVRLHAAGKAPVEAEVLDIGRDYSLIVRCGDGGVLRVTSGEVSIRAAD